MKKLYLLSICLLVACGGPYVRIEKPQFDGPNEAYTLELPVGWVQSNFPGQSETVSISRDGFTLQTISIFSAKHDKAFPKLKKGLSADTSVSDLAELQIAEMKAQNANPSSIEVLENKPAQVAGKKGFLIHIKYLNEKGLRFEQRVYGVTDAHNYFTLSYSAPVLHYFQRDRQIFEQTVNSFKTKA